MSGQAPEVRLTRPPLDGAREALVRSLDRTARGGLRLAGALAVLGVFAELLRLWRLPSGAMAAGGASALLRTVVGGCVFVALARFALPWLLRSGFGKLLSRGELVEARVVFGPAPVSSVFPTAGAPARLFRLVLSIGEALLKTWCPTRFARFELTLGGQVVTGLGALLHEAEALAPAPAQWALVDPSAPSRAWLVRTHR